jgi:D-3-phosphoglycerate dehydrogenase
MAMTKILVADSMDKEALDQMRAIPGFDVTVKTGMGEADLVKTVPGFNAIVVRSATKITRPVIEAGSDLKLLVRAGIGLDNIDSVAAKEKGIAVANTPAATSISVAEHTFGLMLGVVRNHGKAILSMKQHKWDKKSLEGTELFGKTLGIIGCGRIGIEVARRAIAFGMKVVAYDVIPIKTDLAVKQVTLDELLSQADLITVHVPKQPKPILGEAEFKKMKDGVIIINVARGGVVDEKALLAGLNSGKVRAAALDVYDKEPPEDFSLIDHPNVTPIPHLGAAAVEGQRRAGLEVVRILREKLG